MKNKLMIVALIVSSFAAGSPANAYGGGQSSWRATVMCVIPNWFGDERSHSVPCFHLG